MNKVFLDLEDTIIDTWDSGNLRNVLRIKGWLDTQPAPVEELRIFSFAIWNDAHKDHFNTHMRKGIEEALERPIVEWLSVEEMAAMAQARTGLNWTQDITDTLDFMQIMGKHGAFKEVCLYRERDCTCTLIDDAIPYQMIVDYDLNLCINLLPIQNIR